MHQDKFRLTLPQNVFLGEKLLGSIALFSLAVLLASCGEGPDVSSYENDSPRSSFSASCPDSLETRSKASIIEKIQANTPKLRLIQNKYPNVQGQIKIQFLIRADGNIDPNENNTKIWSSTTGNPEFDQEILEAVKQWKWEDRACGNTTVTVPFTFV